MLCREGEDYRMRYGLLQGMQGVGEWVRCGCIRDGGLHRGLSRYGALRGFMAVQGMDQVWLCSGWRVLQGMDEAWFYRG